MTNSYWNTCFPRWKNLFGYPNGRKLSGYLFLITGLWIAIYRRSPDEVSEMSMLGCPRCSSSLYRQQGL